MAVKAMAAGSALALSQVFTLNASPALFLMGAVIGMFGLLFYAESLS